jgi:hypothetical protein
MARCDAGDPLWAETGFAKIDGKMGKIIGVDADGNDIRAESRTPLLTSLKEQAKEEAKREKENQSVDHAVEAEDEEDELEEFDQ